MLSARSTDGGESDYSWTVDFAGRRARARDEAAPHLTEVDRQRGVVADVKERLAALRRGGATDTELTACQNANAVAEKAAREAQARADVMDAAVYDLKAVNPRARVVRDTRTPTQIIDAIAEHGRAVDAALDRLRDLLRGDSCSLARRAIATRCWRSTEAAVTALNAPACCDATRLYASLLA
jgi:type I restriction enzyme M protein